MPPVWQGGTVSCWVNLWGGTLGFPSKGWGSGGRLAMLEVGPQVHQPTAGPHQLLGPSGCWSLGPPTESKASVATGPNRGWVGHHTTLVGSGDPVDIGLGQEAGSCPLMSSRVPVVIELGQEIGPYTPQTP